ncbi:glutamate racemase [Escherichia coli]
MATKLQDGNTPCLAATPSEPRPTVLVFDSGVGGLSVYDEIRHLLPDLHYIYAFDNVAFPYGEKSEEFIVERVVAIVTAVQERYPLALAVVACNTASTVSLPALREKFDFPVVGVVPAIKPAARLTANGIVGLLATRGTVKRSYTHELIARFANECQIEMLGSAEMVELAEAKAAWRRCFSGCTKTYPTPVVKNERAARYRCIGLHPFPSTTRRTLTGAARGNPAGGFWRSDCSQNGLAVRT